MAALDDNQAGSVGGVLAAGGKLFLAGLPTAFPWVLAAELLVLLPFAGPGGSILDTDLANFVQPTYLSHTLLIGAVQAFLYCIAILYLARLTGAAPQGTPLWGALRNTFSLFIGYLLYELIVLFGLGLTMLVFVLALMVLGLTPAFVLCIVPLAPTAAASTALALFAYPAVLERRGPFAALNESSRLARSAWARVSLVITVPALAILLVWCVDNGGELMKALAYIQDVMQRAQGAGSADELQALGTLQGMPPPSQAGLAFRLMGAVLGALAWWYTLAVCYAQYRALKLADSKQ